jgi:hypothetical protein
MNASNQYLDVRISRAELRIEVASELTGQGIILLASGPYAISTAGFPFIRPRYFLGRLSQHYRG